MAAYAALLFFSFPAAADNTSSACDFALDLSASGTPHELMNEIAKRAGFVLHAVEQPERELQIRQRGTPEQLLEAILGHRNWIAAHRNTPDCAQKRLAEIWVLGPSQVEDIRLHTATDAPVTPRVLNVPPSQPVHPDTRTEEQRRKHPRPGEMTPEERRAYRERMDGKRNREPEFH